MGGIGRRTGQPCRMGERGKKTTTGSSEGEGERGSASREWKGSNWFQRTQVRENWKRVFERVKIRKRLVLTKKNCLFKREMVLNGSHQFEWCAHLDFLYYLCAIFRKEGEKI